MTTISIHAPYKRERLMLSLLKHRNKCYFNPRSLQEGATKSSLLRRTSTAISIHAPYKRERLYIDSTLLKMQTFQSTLPTRGSDGLILLS